MRKLVLYKMAEQRISGCASQGFRALLATQFLGALNDNLFRLLLALLIIGGSVSAEREVWQLFLLNLCFITPFVFFAPLAGSLGDKLPKSSIIRGAKIAEMVIMTAAVSFFLTGNVAVLLGLLFLMGLQSTVFSPAKYGILPEILVEEELSRGNGYLGLFTFLAIILGTALGGILLSLGGGPALPAVVLVVVSLVGILLSVFVTRTTSKAPDKEIEYNPLRVLPVLRDIAGDRALLLCLIGTGYFWALASLYQLNILLYAKRVAGFAANTTALLLAVLALGIGVGSAAAGRVSAGRVELGLVPLGAAGISFAGIFLAFSPTGVYTVALILFVLGFSSGIYLVPLNAFFQSRSPVARRASYLAAESFAANLGMLFFSFMLVVLVAWLNLSSALVFLITGILTIAVVVYLCTLMPEMLLRCVNWLLLHTLYRIRVRGAENIPKAGGALLVCNHISYIDALLLLAALPRPIRFMMYEPIYERSLIKPFAQAMGVIALPQNSRPKVAARALAAAGAAVQNGEIVGIFAEGGISRSGMMLGFQRGLERIMRSSSAPIIPVYIDQIWGSIFSYSKGRAIWKIPREIPYPATISIGRSVEPATKAWQLHQLVEELGSEAAILRSQDRLTRLDVEFVRQVRTKPWAACAADSTGRSIRRISLFTAAAALARELPQGSCSGRIGIYLPPSLGALIANVSVTLRGDTAVNFNYTASQAALSSAVKRSAVPYILTSRIFVEKIGLDPAAEMLFIEDLLAHITWGKRLAALFSLVMPIALLRRSIGGSRHPQELATVIFSSGSTGEPKGVMLSHAGILANLEAIAAVLHISSNDVVLGVLPFFHSLGFTATLWLPILSGVKAVYHYNPLDADGVAVLASRHRVTATVVTPAFLQTYSKRCRPEDLKTLRLVVCGGEKMRVGVAQAFQEKFGIKPLEGYGATELSPVVSLNVPDHQINSQDVEIGSKPLSVGRPLPGVAVKIVDPETLEMLEYGKEGLILVHGPNVMEGYLGNPDLTKDVKRLEWYHTGDIGYRDQDGFLFITDRITRFSKIGGEMIPHERIEEELQSLVGTVEKVFAVTAVPDNRKGELLVVLTTLDVKAEELTRGLSDRGLPNLWIPKRGHFFKIAEIPLLGSGKIDLSAIKNMARELVA